MSVVLWGARRYDLQAGSSEDRFFADLQAVWSTRPVSPVLGTAVPLTTRCRGHRQRLAGLLRIHKR